MNHGRLEYEALPEDARPAPRAPISWLDLRTSEFAAVIVLICSSACLGALSWWLAVYR